MKCVSINNQEWKVRPEIININSCESLFYPYSILINKCNDSCNKIKDPYAKLWILKYSIWYQKLIKQGIYLGMRLVHVNADDIQVFLMASNVGIRLAKVDVIKDLFGILVFMNLTVVNHVT